MRKKAVFMSLVGALFASASVNAADKGWSPLAGLDDDYVMEPTVSLLGGMMSPSDGDSGKLLGVELSFNCPLLQPPTNKIRQQLSYTQYDESGVKVSSIELNPHYVVAVTPELSIGGGPGFGYVSVDSAAKDVNLFAAQVGVSAHYQVSEMIFLGGDMRYQLTESEDIGGSDGMNNMRMSLKIGVSF